MPLVYQAAARYRVDQTDFRNQHQSPNRLHVFNMTPLNDAKKNLDNNHAKVDEISSILKSFLERGSIDYPDPSKLVYDTEFAARVRHECAQRGMPVEGEGGVASFISPAVCLVQHSYAHLDDADAAAFIALFTTIMFYAGDTLARDVEGVSAFHVRFARGERQEDPAVEGIAQVLRELPDHFGAVAANMMLTSMLNLLNSLLLDHETHGMTLQKSATTYPYFSRCMNGASEAYAAFVFPRGMPLQDYIQAIPEVMLYINSTNDLLSFYKEEIAGESENQVSILAGVHGVSKMEALKRVADEGVAAHESIQNTLKANQSTAALDAYIAFSRGFVAFHVASSRYRLQELGL